MSPACFRPAFDSIAIGWSDASAKKETLANEDALALALTAPAPFFLFFRRQHVRLLP